MIHRLTLLTIAVLTLTAGAPAEWNGHGSTAFMDTTLTLGNRPAVVAFVSVPQATFLEQPGLPQVQVDFEFFLRGARAELGELQVDVHEVHDTIILLRTQGREWALPIDAGLPVGYYLWSPGKQAYICRGVRASPDIVKIVREFLQEAQAGPRTALDRCERVDA